MNRVIASSAFKVGCRRLPPGHKLAGEERDGRPSWLWVMAGIASRSSRMNTRDSDFEPDEMAIHMVGLAFFAK